MQNNVVGCKVRLLTEFQRTGSLRRRPVCSVLLVGASIFLLYCQRSNINLAALQRPKTRHRLIWQAVRDAEWEEETYILGYAILKDLCILKDCQK